ncbi:MAG: protein-L-isoaspartate(D-aspartate) O-methyltransferase [Candidatus Diapherotrites archaeon]|nr:protein-L-isoaspartate(D-aspartate) O-methyltransferase [Candidatus Diapherotrites archaeon]
MRTNDGLIDYLKHTGVLYDGMVEQAMRRVDRLAFIDPIYQNQAYEDRALPTALGQTISAPHMVAIMSQHLAISQGMKILEIGAGSGYQAAVLSELVGPAGEVHTIERIPALASTAEKRLIVYSNVRIHIGNGAQGLKPLAPFDRILVTAAAHSVPQALLDQLAEGGRMIIPIGHGAAQRLILVEKIAGSVRKTDLACPCIFVPLVG